MKPSAATIQAIATAFTTMGLCTTLLGMPMATPVREQEAGSKTVRDGIYSARQAESGEDTYLQHCSTCHGANLNGGEAEAPLVGAEFNAIWSNKTVGDLFAQVQQTMPKDQPGGLSSRDYADVIAYVLRANHYPAGEEALSTSVNVLKQIKWAPPQ